MNYQMDEPPTRRMLYRSRNGMILGVCRGVAEYMNFSVGWTRVIAVAFLFFGYIVPALVVYFVVAILMKPEPMRPFESDLDQEFYHSFTDSRILALHRLKRTFDNLDKRIQRMEDTVTRPEYDWDRRLNS